MGCTASTNKSKGTIGTVTDETSTDAVYAKLKKRCGHPSYYKSDGYELGIRVKEKDKVQSVFMASSKVNGSKFIAIEYHLAGCQESEVTDAIVNLSKLSHSSIPKLIEVFITDISVFAITEYVDSMRLKNFVDTRNNSTTLSLSDARAVFKSLVDVTRYCHEEKIIIRGLTPSNIAVKKASSASTKSPDDQIKKNSSLFDVKIADFSQSLSAGSFKVLCDHPLFDWHDVPFMAPEALLGHPYGTPMDIWSLGVLLFMMISGSLPFYNADDQELIHQIKFATFSYQDNPIWKSIPEEVTSLISSMLVANPAQRVTMKDLVNNPWVTNGQQ